MPTHTWWIAGLFSAGSVCFALGSFPPYLDRVSSLADGLTFFIGSIGFTLASFLCFLEAAGRCDDSATVGLEAQRRSLLQVESVAWWSAIVQLAGTLWFNVMTLRAVVILPTAPGDVPGREVSWWVVTLNLLGSIAFGVSAVGAFTLPSTDDVVSFRLDNGGTFVGAICFLVAAVLLVPEARRMVSDG